MDLQLWGGISIIVIAIFIVGCMIAIMWYPDDFAKKSKRRRKHR